MEENRKKRVEIRLTELEKEVISLRAEAANYPSISSFIRSAALKGIVLNINFEQIYPYMNAVEQLAKEIKRIGVNENQLAKQSNQNNWTYVERNLHAEILDELKVLSEQLNEIYEPLKNYFKQLNQTLERLYHGIR